MKKFLKKVSLVFFVILLCFQNLCHADLVAPEPSQKEGLIALGIFIVPAIVGLLLTITIAVVIIVLIVNKNNSKGQNKGDINGK